jgi:chorismate-pyruvate lyase
MIETKTSPAWAPFAPRSLYSTTYPLDDFYAVRRLPLPVMEQIEPDQVPEPYRSLLVHDSDMTTRLEAFHKSKIHIRALARNPRGRAYFREVVLELDGSRRPVEFGATKVNLDLFPANAHEEIRREERPLGGILRDFNIAFSSRPGAFFRVTADSFIGGALGLSDAPLLFGRRNTLLDDRQRAMAEIVEILPP